MTAILGAPADPAASTATAVVLDRHPLWRMAAERSLELAGVAVTGSAADPAAALRLVGELGPDLFVAELDPGLNTGETLEAIRAARERSPTLVVIVLSTALRFDVLRAAADAGVSAYIVKTTKLRELAATVEQSFRCALFLGSSGVGNAGVEPDPGLTTRERDTLALAAEGRTNTEIARILWVSLETVKSHLSSTYRKLGVANRTEAARWAQLHGIVPPTPLPGVAAGAVGASRPSPHAAARPSAHLRSVSSP